MKVRDLLRGKMDGDVITIEENSTAREASQLLKAHNIGALPVIGKKKLVGILSERDIARCVADEDEVANVKVKDLMTSEVIICACDDQLQEVMNVITKNRIRHLPVIDNDELVGIISIGDVVKSLLVEKESEAEHLRNYITGGHT